MNNEFKRILIEERRRSILTFLGVMIFFAFIITSLAFGIISAIDWKSLILKDLLLFGSCVSLLAFASLLSITTIFSLIVKFISPTRIELTSESIIINSKKVYNWNKIKEIYYFDRRKQSNKTLDILFLVYSLFISTTPFSAIIAFIRFKLVSQTLEKTAFPIIIEMKNSKKIVLPIDYSLVASGISNKPDEFEKDIVEIINNYKKANNIL